jgi:hypothetical protein
VDLHAVEVLFTVFAGERSLYMLMDYVGKSRDGLYEPVLAESEREAVADLLQYLENVWTALSNPGHTNTDSLKAGRDRLLFRRTLTSFEHPCFLR